MAFFSIQVRPHVVAYINHGVLTQTVTERLSQLKQNMDAIYVI